jgi:signal transduction histidine kinase/CheY-like chemotaxis protein
MNIPILQVALRNDQDLITARQRAKDIAEKAGLNHQDQTRFITAVSEIARNALMYAGGGKLRLGIVRVDGNQYVQAAVSDTGRGIANLNLVLEERYVSRTGLGKGIAGTKRIMDLFEITTGKDGTTVMIGKMVPQGQEITTKTVTGWLKSLEKTDVANPVDQLQEQNQQLMQTLDELQKATAQVEQASRQKDQFLANISHEIRTPLNALLGLNKILSRTNLDQEQQRLVKLSRDAGQTLLALINDVLDLSKIESGKMQIHAVEFDLRAMVSSVSELFFEQASEKGIALEMVLQPDLPKYVIGDDLRIKQILVNLIGNAIKFSTQGKVSIFAKVQSQSEKSCTIAFRVKDRGPGIAEDRQKLLFQAFSQVDGSVTRQHGGTGLGLAISKHLVELMSGEIGVESTLGHGSTFWFQIPLLIADDAHDAREAASRAPDTVRESRSAKGKVLVAEDHPVNRLVAASELEEFGLEVQLADNGEEAFSLACKHDYAIIFMDCQMPVMDGYTATRMIRKKGNKVPIVAMTANALEGERERCLQAGMDDYISKPFETSDLERVITRWLTSEPSPDELLNETSLRNRFNEKNLQKLLHTFVDDVPNSVGSVNKAFEKEDFSEMARCAHAFKGACSMLFATRLAATMSAIEAAAREKRAEELSVLVQEMNLLAKSTVEICNRLLASQEAKQ